MAVSGGASLAMKVLRLTRFAVEKTGRLIRDKLPQATRAAQGELQPVYARNNTRQPIGRIAQIRQYQALSQSARQAAQNTTRNFSTASSKPTFDRSKFTSTRVGQTISRLTSRAPFTSTLRPNLTGGTLGRTAGGYGGGAGHIGGARYFSHVPAAQSQVVNNVSQAVRAFWLSGQKVQYDGINPRGEKKYKTVTALQDKASRKIRNARPAIPGSYLDFVITPTITAVGPLSETATVSNTQALNSLGSEGLMDKLNIDFARTLKDLAAISNDLKRLSSLGDLPVSLQNSSTLRVRFPGCDADTLERLCQELGIRRGLVHQDADFDVHNGTEMALLFPFASSQTPSEMAFSPVPGISGDPGLECFDWQEMMSPKQKVLPNYSKRSGISHDFDPIDEIDANPWLGSPSDYSSLHGTDEEDVQRYFTSDQKQSHKNVSDYEGVAGIYKFLEECDRAKR